MTQKGFEEYVNAVFGNKTGAANSYINAIRIIDQMFAEDDVFSLKGQSIACIDDVDLFVRITEYVYSQLSLYKDNKDSIFRNIKPNQKSYPSNGFCSAAIRQLVNYFENEKGKQADLLLSKIKAGATGEMISKKLVKLFDVNKEGKDKIVETKTRIGQEYFRKIVLTNYENKCCVTGLNVPETLIASHIVAWKENKAHRMDPENGLCLRATYDAVFDKHLISFDEDYRMIVSKQIKWYYTNDVTKEYFDHFEGKQISLPTLYLPSQNLLAKHRELLVG